MRTNGLIFLAGLITAAASAGCAGSTPSAQAKESDAPAKAAAKAPENKAADKAADKPAEKAPEDKATAEEAPSAESEEDGNCKGQVCIARCDKQGRPADCLEAGEAYRQGSDGIKESAASAAKYLEKACSLKEREGCYRLADMYKFGAEGVPQDDAKVVPLLTAACDLGRGDACDQLAKRAEAGDGTKKDHARAIALLAKGCAAEDYQAWTCNAFNKARDAKDKEVAKAVAALKKACSAKDKNAAACAGLDRIGAQ
jgi:hypothetical protein